MMTDPIADMLARIRNAGAARHVKIACPSSKLKQSIANVLQEAGFVSDVRVEASEGRAVLVISIRYNDRGKPMIGGLKRVSKPSVRRFTSVGRIPKVLDDLGISVLSTSKGVISHREARRKRVGGELLCQAW